MASNITGASYLYHHAAVCAKMLINAGIEEIVYANPYPDELLAETDIKLRVYGAGLLWVLRRPYFLV